MRKFLILILALMMAVNCVGCGADEAVEETTVEASEASSAAAEEEQVESEVETKEETLSDAETAVDLDLTSMSSEMVYATVYQMLVDPDSYTGSTVCMSGQYYASYYEGTQQYYHYCIIADATACCSQGMEFVLADATWTYPDDYPQDYQDIVVVGTFGSYEEEGYTYYCLLEARLEVEKVT